MVLGSCYQQRCNHLGALPFLEESVKQARAVGDSWCLIHSLSLCGQVHHFRNSLGEARPLLEEAVEVARSTEDAQAVAFALKALANCLLNFDTDPSLVVSLLEEVAETVGDG